MIKTLKEWTESCRWNGWNCENCDNKTITYKLYVDDRKLYVAITGNGRNCLYSELDTGNRVDLQTVIFSKDDEKYDNN